MILGVPTKDGLHGDALKEEEEKVIMVNDIARIEAPIRRTVAVELPDEDKSDDKDMVGLLQKSLYGTRDAAINFQRKVQKFMRSQGFSVGRYKCSFFIILARKKR